MISWSSLLPALLNLPVAQLAQDIDASFRLSPRLIVGHDWGGSVAWATAMAHPEAVNRLAILNAAHPRKLSQGLHHPGQLRKSWYFFFFDLPELPESIVHANHWNFFRHFLHDAHPASTPKRPTATSRRGRSPARPPG